MLELLLEVIGVIILLNILLNFLSENFMII
jgi:hypothetical protein